MSHAIALDTCASIAADEILHRTCNTTSARLVWQLFRLGLRRWASACKTLASKKCTILVCEAIARPHRRGPRIGRRDCWLRYSHGAKPAPQNGHRGSNARRIKASGGKRRTVRAKTAQFRQPSARRQPPTTGSHHGSRRRGEGRRADREVPVRGPGTHGVLPAVHGDDAPDHSHVEM